MVTDNELVDKVALKQRGNIQILTLKNSIQTPEAEQIEMKLESLYQGEKYHIIIDMSRTNHICSSALGVLVSYKRNFTEKNGDIRLVFKSDELKQLFEVTMLDKVFEIYYNLQEALDVYSSAHG